MTDQEKKEPAVPTTNNPDNKQPEDNNKKTIDITQNKVSEAHSHLEESKQGEGQEEEKKQESIPPEENTRSINQSTLYPRDHWVILQSLLERNGVPNKKTELTVECLGIYSLPEFWNQLDASGACDSWYYELKISDAVVINGKGNPRELTEEEKNALDNKKKPAPKIDKKNPDAVREEEERLEKLKQEKEEREQKVLDELEQLEPMERFYKVKEMPTVGEWVSFGDEDKKKTIELNNEQMMYLESCINDEHSILIEVNKVPPPDENEKKRPKPKNLNPDDIKPVYAVGLGDLTEFYQVPGKKELVLRTQLMLKETYDKRKENGLQIELPFDPLSLNLNPFTINATKESDKEEKKPKKEETKPDAKETKGEGEEEKKEEEPSVVEGEEPDYIEKAHTYVYYKISFSEPINPKLKKEDEKAEPAELIKTKNEGEDQTTPKSGVLQPKVNSLAKETLPQEEQAKPAKPIAADEICTDFRNYIKIFISSICKSYEDSMGGDSNKNQFTKRDKGGILSNAKKEERDANISKFQMKFVENGRAANIKEKLRKFIIRIALEKYKKRKNFIESFKDQKDKFFSELYAYICDEIKLGMDEFMLLKKDDLHDNITSSYEQSRRDVIAYAVRQHKEPEEKRLLRLSKEYEIIEDLPKAMLYYKSRLTIIQNRDSWLNFIILAKKMNSLVEVEEAIKTCIRLPPEPVEKTTQTNIMQQMQQGNKANPDEFNLKLLFSAVKYLKGRIKDAIDNLLAILHNVSLKGTNCNFNAFLAFLFKESDNKLMFTKHYEAAKRFKMIENGINVKKPKVNLKVKTEYKPPQLPPDQCDVIWYNLVNMFNEYQFFEISEKLLEFITEENKTSIKFLLEKAKIALFKKDANDVIERCNEIIEKDPENYQAWVLRGNAYHLINNLFDSEESYVKGIRCKPEKEKFDIKMLTTLGITYIRRKTWGDAKTVFLHILKDSPYHSFAWRYLGLALTRLKEYEAAEEALNEAISLDIENPLTWAFITMFCLDVGRKPQAFASLNELIKMGFSDIEVTSEIAHLFYKSKDFQIAGDLYKRIIHFEPSYIDAYIRLAEVYSLRSENKQKEAIRVLESSLNYVKTEKEKNLIKGLIATCQNQKESRGNVLYENEMNISGESGIQNQEDHDEKDSLENSHPLF